MANNKPILILFIILMIIGALKVMESILGITIIHFPLLPRNTKSKESSPSIKVAAATTGTNSCSQEIYPSDITSPMATKFNAWCEKIVNELNPQVTPFLVIQRRSVSVCSKYDSDQLLDAKIWCKTNTHYTGHTAPREIQYYYNFAYYWFDDGVNSLRKNRGHKFANFIPQSTKVWAWNEWCFIICTSNNDNYPKDALNKEFNFGYHSLINDERKNGGVAIDNAINNAVTFESDNVVSTTCMCQEKGQEPQDVDIHSTYFNYCHYSQKIKDVFLDDGKVFAKYKSTC